MTRPLEYEPPRRGRVNLSAPMLTVCAVLSAWAAATMGSLLFPLPLVFAALLAARRRWRLLGVSLALSPMTIAAVVGTVGYLTGTASLRGTGLPGTGYFNLHPEFRCGRSTGGCLVNGGEVLTDAPNNFAIMALTRLFGPQRGAYTGPYPSESQAKSALASASATLVSLQLMLKDQVHVPGASVKLDAGVGRALLDRTYAVASNPADQAATIAETAEYGLPTAALYQKRCLILRVPMPWQISFRPPTEKSAMIVLLDTQTGRPFAYYGEGQFHQRAPPVPWRK